MVVREWEEKSYELKGCKLVWCGAFIRLEP